MSINTDFRVEFNGCNDSVVIFEDGKPTSVRFRYIIFNSEKQCVYLVKKDSLDLITVSYPDFVNKLYVDEVVYIFQDDFTLLVDKLMTIAMKQHNIGSIDIKFLLGSPIVTGKLNVYRVLETIIIYKFPSRDFTLAGVRLFKGKSYKIVKIKCGNWTMVYSVSEVYFDSYGYMWEYR